MIIVILITLYILGFLLIYLISTNNVMVWNRKESILPFDNIEQKFLTSPKRVYWLVKQNSTKWAVLMHQYGGRADYMLKQGKIYHELGFNLLFIDARSHGISQYVIESNGVIYARDMFEILQKEGIKDIFLHGVSFGGIAVLISTRQMPKDIRIRGIIVEAVPKDVKNIYKHNIEYSPIPFFLYFWFPYYMRYRRRFFDWEGNSLDLLLSKLECPVLIVHSEHDTLYKPEIHFEANKKAITNNSRGEAWLAMGMRHSHMNENPDWAGVVKSFVQKYAD